MRATLSFLLLVFTACTSAQTITVTTYNIRNSSAADGVNKWDKRKHTLIATITKANPDILGTQEVRYDQYKDLKKLLPGYEIWGAGRNNGKHAGEHSAILYKRDKYGFITGGNFWLSETPAIPGSKSWDAAITRICTWAKLKDKTTGKELFVFNTHFDHKGKQARIKSAALIRHMIDSLAGNDAVVVMGDFNFRPDNEGYKIITGDNYKVALTDAITPGALPYTDCGFNVSNTNCSRIDYIFYSKQFTRQTYTVHTDNNGIYYPSDHLAVTATFKFD